VNDEKMTFVWLLWMDCSQVPQGGIDITPGANLQGLARRAA